MARTKLPWPSYKAEAQKLFNKGLKPAQIKQELGDPYWEGKPWHIESDKGTIKRKTLEARQNGKASSEATRRRNLKLSPPKDKAERNENRRQDYQRSAMRKAGKDVVIDHRVDLHLLGETTNGMPLEDAKKHVSKLEESYGPLGNRPGARQLLSASDNELKRQQSQALQKHLGTLDKIANTVRRSSRASRNVTQPNPNNSPLAALAEATRTGSTTTFGDTHPLGGSVAETDPLGILLTPRIRLP